MKKNKYDSIPFGFALGVIGPLLIAFILFNGGIAYLESLSFSGNSINVFRNDRELIGLALQFGGMVNLIGFYTFYVKYMLAGMRGIILGTLLYFLGVLIFSFV